MELPPLLVVPTPAVVEELEPPAITGTSHSVGLPFRGRLVDGHRLEESELIRFKHGTPEPERFATDEMVALLESAARVIARAHPGAALTVGDLSRARGGRMRPHRSHRNGRDADVVFYALDEQGAVAQPDRLVGYRADGAGRAGDGVQYRFDDARNWELVAYLLDNPVAEVQYVFISRHLKRRLIAEARRQGASPELIERAERVLRHRGGRHHDHMHFRILCDDADTRCRDVGVPRRR
jgi:penicillin-insensitive murein endopeptidase